MHFDEIPSKELEEILHHRCHLPVSYSKKFVKVMHDLQVSRRINVHCDFDLKIRVVNSFYSSQLLRI